MDNYKNVHVQNAKFLYQEILCLHKRVIGPIQFERLFNFYFIFTLKKAKCFNYNFSKPSLAHSEYNAKYYFCNSQYNFKHDSFPQYLAALMKSVVFTDREANVTKYNKYCIGMYIHQISSIYSLIVNEQELFGVQLNNVIKFLSMKPYGVLKGVMLCLISSTCI